MGAFIVWIPAVFFLALEGSWGKALIFTLWGIFIVGTIDNLLRPILVVKRLKLHTVVTFMSIVGGLFLFGPAGLVLGPVVLTVTAGCWKSGAIEPHPRRWRLLLVPLRNSASMAEMCDVKNIDSSVSSKHSGVEH